MRIRYCPRCGKAGLKWDDANGKGFDGLTDHERYERFIANNAPPTNYHMRYCPRCAEWVNPDIGANIDQHKR